MRRGRGWEGMKGFFSSGMEGRSWWWRWCRGDRGEGGWSHSVWWVARSASSQRREQ